MTPTPRDRFRGALVGLAVGDALGASVEFKAPGTFPAVTDMDDGGTHNLPAGAWTDDTSMALCLAESLIERCGFDPVDQLQRYVRWYREGHLSSTGSCFDIGCTTREALERFEHSGEPFPGDPDPGKAGNGSLMRLAPVVLAYASDRELAIRRADESSRTTHAAPQAVDACRYFAGLLLGALDGVPKVQLLREGGLEPVAGIWAREPLHPEVAEVAYGSFLRKRPPAIEGDGYVVRSLEAALWGLAENDSFQTGVLAAVNLGNDSDTTGAVYGQIAGALYGLEAIPTRWRDRLVDRDRIEDFADRLYELAPG